MKIREITNMSKIKKIAGNNIEIDHGDGTTTTVDTKKNPTAIARDPSGKLTIQDKPKNSQMAKQKQQAQKPKPGEKIEIK
ncbi:MAG: hypothetical protein VW454_07320 [Pelagibacteraceae bacterium]|jgi:hypothetical protein